MFAQLLDSWTSLYSNHAAIRTAVEFAHIAALTAGGGAAIAADLATLASSRRDAAARVDHAELLARTHLLAIAGLTVLFISGLLLLGADVDTYWPSRIFWIKMGLVLLLLLNGVFLRRSEGRVGAGDPTAWPPLRRAATISLVLWSLTTLAGAALPNIG